MAVSPHTCLTCPCPPLSGEYVYVDQTERMKNNHDPDFQKCFVVQHPEHNQASGTRAIKLMVYDVDGDGSKVDAPIHRPLSSPFPINAHCMGFALKMASLFPRMH